MANKHRGEVNITLLGKTWTLRPTFGALAEIEDATGMGLAAVIQRFASGAFSIEDVAIVLHEGMRAVHDDAPDLDAIKHAIIEEGFSTYALAAGGFLGNAVLRHNPVKNQAEKVK